MGQLTYQDNHLAYDALGNLRDVADARVHISMEYDKAAIYASTPVNYVSSSGWSTEQYRYDALNRLQSVVRDGVQIDLRYYDGADRVVQSGPGGALPQGYAAALNQGVAPGQGNGQETRINRYDADGRLLHQKVLKSDNTPQSDISWDPAEALGAARRQHPRPSSKVQRNAVSRPRGDARAKEICILGPDRTAKRHGACKHRPIVGIADGDSLERLCLHPHIEFKFKGLDYGREAIQNRNDCSASNAPLL